MKILGINFSNDSAAALIEDGVVIAACQEERFTRQKHDSSFPERSIDFCLEHAKISLTELDAVAFFWNPGIHSQAPTKRMASTPRHQLEFLYDVPVHLISKLHDEEVSAVEQIFHMASGKSLKIHYVTHHLCHAASAFYTSPFNDAAILTVDGYGEMQSTGIYKGKDNRIEQLSGVNFPHSIGSFYAAFTQYLGFTPNSGEGKVMGLASYGRKSDCVEKVRDMVVLGDSGFELDLSYFEYFHDRSARYSEKLISILGQPRVSEAPIKQRHMDIAFAIQAITEEIIIHLARLVKEKTGASALCLAGGVGLNCVANGRLAREGDFDKFFFYPAAGDAGTSVGAALWVWHQIMNGARSGKVASEYLGPSYSNDEIETVLKKAGVSYSCCDNACVQAAQMIAEGKMIGWFQGKAEFGPRALGNRSILADPRRSDMKDILNSKVKFREEFRPYAPSVLEDRCGEYFSSNVPSPYMLRAYETLGKKKSVLASITHVDNTARVQTVNQSQNSKYYNLISELDKLTGVPVVLNTSFNIRGEPIVHTVEDALKCLFTTGLDALFAGDFMISKS